MDEPKQIAGHLGRNLTSLRHVRGLTQEALAQASGVPRSTVANLESGDANPSLAVLVKVASALGVPIDELLASPGRKVRTWQAADIAAKSPGRGVRLRPLVPEPVPDGILELMDLDPGGSMRGEPHLPGTREYFTCLAGAVTIYVAGERYELKAGGVLAFPGNVPHAYRNPDDRRPATGVSVVVLAKAGS